MRCKKSKEHDADIGSYYHIINDLQRVRTSERELYSHYGKLHTLAALTINNNTALTRPALCVCVCVCTEMQITKKRKTPM